MKNALRIWGEDLKEKVLASGGTVVIRPDSGDPTEMVLMTAKSLDHYYGSTVNDKGYKVLHPAVRIIQGDGVNLEKVEEILQALKDHGYSADNIVFGCGGYLLQDMTRDTLRFAMKGSYIEVNGVARDIKKTVETDPTKASKAGRLALVENEDGGIETVIEKEVGNRKNLLATVYNKGMIMRRDKFEDIRKRIDSKFT